MLGRGCSHPDAGPLGGGSHRMKTHPFRLTSLSVVVVALSCGAQVQAVHAGDSSLDAKVHETTRAVGDAARQVGEGAKHAGQEIAHEATKVGHQAADTAKKAGRAVAEGARRTGTEVKKATHEGVTAVKHSVESSKSSGS